MSGVDVLAVALFEAYSHNSGNPPDTHFDRKAAEHWMAQALVECGVAELIEALSVVPNNVMKYIAFTGVDGTRIREIRISEQNLDRLLAAFARVTGEQA